MTITVELRCEVTLWMRFAIFALALMKRVGLPIDCERFSRLIAARMVKSVIVERDCQQVDAS